MASIRKRPKFRFGSVQGLAGFAQFDSGSGKILGSVVSQLQYKVSRVTIDLDHQKCLDLNGVNMAYTTKFNCYTAAYYIYSLKFVYKYVN